MHSNMNTGWTIARIVMMLGVVISSPALNGQDSLSFSDARLIQADTVFSSSRIALDDLDGDGDPDVVINLQPDLILESTLGTDEPNGLAFYSNDGMGGFSLEYRTGFPQDLHLHGNIAIGDINGDGNPDAGAIFRNDDLDLYSLVFYIWISEWAYAPLLVYESAQPFNRFAIQDFDQDGHQDVALYSANGDVIHFYLNNGQGNIVHVHTLNTSGHTRVLFGDTDNDGDVDIVTSGGSGVYWFENLDGAFDFESVNISTNPSYRVEELADISNDGYLDILLLVNAGASSLIQQASGNTPFILAPWMVPQGIWESYTRVMAADMDQDGVNDLVLLKYNLQVFGPVSYDLNWHRNTRSGVENSGRRLFSGPFGLFNAALFTGDINSDDRPDVFGTLDGRPIWLERTDSPWMAYHDIAGDPLICFIIEAEDVDLDGDPDILTDCGALAYYNYNPDLTSFTGWNENNGNGVFGARNRLVDGFFNPYLLAMLSPLYSRVHLLDIDGDGIRDIVNITKDSVSSRISWHAHIGNGQYGPPALIGRVETPGSFTAGDLDRDGDMDIVAWREFPYFEDDYPSFTPGLVWYENLGGTFGSPAYFADNLFSNSSFGIGRVDNDPYPDILQFSNYPNSGSISAINDGSQQFTFQPIHWDSSSLTYFLPQYHDMNNDGLLDALGFGYSLDSLGHSVSSIVIFPNPGSDSTWSPRVTYTHDTDDVIVVAIHDLDEDGHPDILFSIQNETEVKWLRNLGDGTFSAASVLLEVESGLNAIYMADLDGDGRSDLIIGPDRHLRINWYRNLSGGEATGIPEGAPSAPTVEVYPNPAAHEVLIRMDDAGTARYDLDLLDLSGRVIRSWKDLTGPVQTIPLHGMSAGVYVIRGRSANGGAFSVRVVKM